MYYEEELIVLRAIVAAICCHYVCIYNCCSLRRCACSRYSVRCASEMHRHFAQANSHSCLDVGRSQQSTARKTTTSTTTDYLLLATIQLKPAVEQQKHTFSAFVWVCVLFRCCCFSFSQCRLSCCSQSVSQSVCEWMYVVDSMDCWLVAWFFFCFLFVGQMDGWMEICLFLT